MTANKTVSNRLNALRSTGPTTVAGKQVSSQNARKHGLSVRKLSAEVEREISSLASTISEATGADRIVANCTATEIVRRQQIDRVRDQIIRNALIETQADPRLTGHSIEVLEDIALMSATIELMRLDDYERRSISKFYKGLRQQCAGRTKPK